MTISGTPSHLDRVGVAELVGCEAAPHARQRRDVAQLGAEPRRQTRLARWSAR